MRGSYKFGGCHGHARVAMHGFSRENMPTTSVGMAPNTLNLFVMRSKRPGRRRVRVGWRQPMMHFGIMRRSLRPTG